MNIGSRLREVILLKNNNLKKFSEDADIPYITLQQYLAGNRKPGMDALIKISVQLNISIDWLLTGEGEMYRKKDVETVEIETSKKTVGDIETSKKIIVFGTKREPLKKSLIRSIAFSLPL